jgi:hypothetical protein
MIYHWDIIQQTDEWHKVKELKMSASHATAIGNCGKGLETYIRQLVRDTIVKRVNYTNKDMERGNELEPIARLTYEFEYNCIVKQIGFITYSDFVGISPDGLIDNFAFIGDDGGLELKARNDDIHFGLLLGDPVDSSAIWQMNMSMLVTGRKWWDFGSYNPNFKQSLYIRRFYPDQTKFNSLLKGFEIGEAMIKSLLENPNVQKEIAA